jgi:ABC-type sugar transport system ATPase subunit
VPDVAGIADGAAISLGIRPEALVLADDGPLAGRVTITEHLGGLTLVHLALTDGSPAIVQIVGACPLATGTPVRLRIEPSGLHLFASDGRRVVLPGEI